MSRFNPLVSGTSTLIALSMIFGAAAPIMTTAPASAQLFPSRPGNTSTLTIPYGTAIPVRYDKADKIVVTPTESVPLTLTVAANIRSRSGTLLIPAGTQVVGQLQPVNGGSQFVAEQLIFYGNRSQRIEATSNIITQTQEVSGANTGNILKNAAIGGAAAAAIGAITGNRKIEVAEVLGGAGVGALSGLLLGRKKADVVVINPNTDLNLTLRSNLAIR